MTQLLFRDEPAAAYPAVIERADGAETRMLLPDFHTGGLQFVGDSHTAKKFLAGLLRERRANSQLFPYASSMESLAKAHPERAIILIPTEGWENPGALEQADMADD